MVTSSTFLQCHYGYFILQQRKLFFPRHYTGTESCTIISQTSKSTQGMRAHSRRDWFTVWSWIQPIPWDLSIFTDNFYSGLELFQNMKSHGLNASGTVCANRKGLPKNNTLSKQASLGKHELKVPQKEDLISVFGKTLRLSWCCLITMIPQRKSQ